MADIGFRVDSLVSHLQKQIIPITVSPKAPPSPGELGSQGTTQPPDWATATFEITSDWPAASIFKGFDTRGVRLLEQSTTIRERKLSYSMKGEIYGK
ncbi:hypothetical protein G6F59_018031 [Rhizopus arrhizus]|nr:hypothetical protein G6F59_018031 [Rhizopus arrhizus]